MPQTVDDARGRSEIAQAALKRTETLLGYARIIAPFNGVVTKRWVDPGAFIPAGNVALLTVVDLSTVRVELPIPEREAPLVNNGLPARVTVEELPGKRFDGTITRFAHALDESTRTMAAEVEIKNPDEALRPGMYAMVQVILQQKTDALVIPVEALVMEKAKGYVFTVDGGKAKRIPVKLGFKDDRSVEILEGLKPEQPVLLAAGTTLADGQAVTPVETK
jgi:membrane fusion protein (multidrug efflux system)